MTVQVSFGLRHVHSRNHLTRTFNQQCSRYSNRHLFELLQFFRQGRAYMTEGRQYWASNCEGQRRTSLSLTPYLINWVNAKFFRLKSVRRKNNGEVTS